MHLVLLGDSVFDNQNYVEPGCDVTHHLKKYLPPSCQVTLLAVDGSVVTQVDDQVGKLPKDTTHIALSVGGNNALKAIPLLNNPTITVFSALRILHAIQSEFSTSFSQLLHNLCALHVPLVVCTVYDGVPGLTNELRTALSLFNDVITKVAGLNSHTVLDLRSILNEDSDYSSISPIEPSSSGGNKLAKLLASCVLNHATPLTYSKLFA